MTDGAKGVAAIICACTIWGLSPLYYAQLTHIPPLDILSYRCLWSVAFFSLILLLQGRLRLVAQALTTPRMLVVILVASLMISANWFGFIYAISVGRAIESSLGYYIFPLVAVVLGWLVFGEALLRAQWLAVALAAIAVVTLTLGLGVAPWIALGLALTFGAYGIAKKRLDLGPVVSVTAEVAVLAPLAFAWLAMRGTALPGDVSSHLLLALSGPLTAIPLVMFSYAARRVRLSTMGVVQFLNPTLQFACAVFVFGEAFTRWHAIAFPLIWLAVTIYSIRAIQADRTSRKDVSNPATSGATVT